MTTVHSGGGDPARSMALLWGSPRPARARGRQPALTIRQITEAAIELADAEGLDALSMRRVAERLGVGTMSLYTYVPGKAELIDLMLDAIYLETGPGLPPGAPWRDRLEDVARDNWERARRHPWMLRIAATSRPPLGPGLIAKYERELETIDGLGLSDIEMDAVVALINDYVHGAARGAVDALDIQQSTGIDDETWWAAAAPWLNKVFDPRRYPVAARVGTAAGEHHRAAYNPRHAFDFGLQRVLDGISTLVRQPSDDLCGRMWRKAGFYGVSDIVRPMTDESSSAAEFPPRPAPVINTKIPHPARVYDYFLGGKDNFEADRIAAEAAIQAFPRTAESARAARAFLRRVVRFLAAEAGIRQFLDIGTGLPSGENVHQVAQSVAPEARIVYVDNDPIVLLHAKTLLTSSAEGVTAFLDADLRDPENILGQAAKTLDFSQPMAVMLLGILHNMGDADDPRGIVRRLMKAVPGGSYLAIGHLTADIYPELAEFARALNERQLDSPLVLRDHAQVTSFFDGLELVEPGVVQLSKWHPQSELESAAAAALWGGVARKSA